MGFSLFLIGPEVVIGVFNVVCFKVFQNRKEDAAEPDQESIVD